MKAVLRASCRCWVGARDAADMLGELSIHLDGADAVPGTSIHLMTDETYRLSIEPTLGHTCTGRAET